jgi:hypothetical protein
MAVSSRLSLCHGDGVELPEDEPTQRHQGWEDQRPLAVWLGAWTCWIPSGAYSLPPSLLSLSESRFLSLTYKSDLTRKLGITHTDKPQCPLSHAELGVWPVPLGARVEKPHRKEAQKTQVPLAVPGPAGPGQLSAHV